MSNDVTPVLTSILSAASSRLNEAGVPASLVHLAPGGQVAWDSCCSGGGQLYLRVMEAYPTIGQGSSGVPFPQYDGAQRGVGCGIVALAYRLALGVIRCAHTLSDEGVAPSAEQMSGDTADAMLDLGLLLDTIACDVAGIPGVMGAKVGRWNPKGVQGGCHGGEWDFHIGIDPCICAVPETEE